MDASSKSFAVVTANRPVWANLPTWGDKRLLQLY
jgi:hypothetical protein